MHNRSLSRLHSDGASLADIGEEIILTEMVPRITQHDLHTAKSLSLTGYSMSRLFAGSLQQIGANRLLHLVVNAQWERIRLVSQSNIRLMFMEASAIEIDGTQISTTPLKYALKVLDAYSRRIFIECIAGDPSLTEEFLRQAEEQNEFITLDAYHDVCESYRDVYRDWALGVVTNEKIAEFWCHQIGTAQAQLLPRHMLIQMCAKDGDANRQDNPPKDLECLIYDHRDGSYFSLFSDMKLGEDFALIRGGNEYAFAEFHGGEPARHGLDNDEQQLGELLEMRKAQQMNEIEIIKNLHGSDNVRDEQIVRN